MENKLISFLEYDDSLSFDDFIYNRFDKQKAEGTIGIIKINIPDGPLFVQYLITGKTIKLGIWLLKLDACVLKKIRNLLFKKYKFVTSIEFPFIQQPLGYYIRKNHYSLSLPDSRVFDEMLKKKHYRESFKRERELSSLLGERKLEIYDASNCPERIIDFYFENKKKTMNIDYGMTKESYLYSYHVSNVYALFFGDTLVSVLLSCEQCEKVYLENLSYDSAFARYSPGKLVYIYFVKEMIKKQKRSIYLGGGDYEYKKYFNSICEEKIIAIAYRSRIKEIHNNFKKVIKKVLKK